VLRTGGQYGAQRIRLRASRRLLKMTDKTAIIAQFENLPEEDYDEVKADFDSMDDDKSGDLSFDEVKKHVAADGGIAEHEVEELMKQYDLDGDGKVTFLEYLQVMGYQLKK
jgi:Ca2+-binding EF-hand superfamily protein